MAAGKMEGGWMGNKRYTTRGKQKEQKTMNENDSRTYTQCEVITKLYGIIILVIRDEGSIDKKTMILISNEDQVLQ